MIDHGKIVRVLMQRAQAHLDEASSDLSALAECVAELERENETRQQPRIIRGLPVIEREGSA